jgi:predicted secreted protein
LKSVLEASSTQQSGAIQDQTAQNLVERKKEFDKALQKTSIGYDGLNKFQLTATADGGKKTKLVFNRQSFAEWKLKSVLLPQY